MNQMKNILMWIPVIGIFVGIIGDKKWFLETPIPTIILNSLWLGITFAALSVYLLEVFKSSIL